MENKEIIRESFIQEIDALIWRKECNAAYDETLIPKLKKERQKAIEEVVKLNEEGKAIEKKAFSEKDNTKSTRIKIKEIKSKIDKANKYADSCEDTIADIAGRIGAALKEVKGLKERVEFARKWKA